MKKFLILFVIILFVNTINAQTNVVHIRHGAKLPTNYIKYFLPKTEIVLEVKVKKHIQKAGRFANYSKRLLELNNIVATDKSFFTIESVGAYDRHIPDSAKQYAVEINLKSTAYKIKTDYQGIIQTININESREPSILNIPQVEPIDTAISFDYSLLGEEALAATTEEKMAEFAAKQILNIRDSRIYLLTGEDERNYDGESLKQILDKLDETERKLTELFTGKMVYYIETKIFRVSPSVAVDNEVFARFSQTLGIVDIDDYVGEPLYLSVKPTDIPQNDISKDKTKKFGIYYNVTAKANVEVLFADKILVDKTFTMPQFGHTAFLPAKMFNKPSTAVEFTEYGTIKAIK